MEISPPLPKKMKEFAAFHLSMVLSPSLLDRLMLVRGTMFEMQKTDQPDDGRDNLLEPVGGLGSTTGDFGRFSKSTSLYTRHLEQYPNRKRALLGLAAAGAVALVRRAGR